jgi:2-(1,2-epoxy-1,2-dihydrophenyl)acetyl-CoA isomerase
MRGPVMEKNYDQIIFENNNGVALLTLNRPDALNSLNVSMMEEMRDAFRQSSSDPSIKALVITGAGRGFCSGADLAGDDIVEKNKSFPGLSVGQIVSEKMKLFFNPIINDIDRMEKPVIMAVNGVAAGGGVGLALCGDIVLAARSASFRLVFGPALGIIPDMGATWLLPRLIGRSRAVAFSFLGEKITAEKAEQWGMIYKCLDDDALLNEAMEIGKKLAAGPTKAWDFIKRAFRESSGNNLADQLEFERYCQLILCDSDDFMEGVAAFVDKRSPVFKGR